MSGNAIVARRYAKALFDIANEQNALTAIETDLRLAAEVIHGDEQIRKVMGHPNIDTKKKIELVREAFASNVSSTVLNTLELLLERNRLSILEDLLNSYISLANEALGQRDAIVYTPKELTEQESKWIAERFGKLTGKTIRMSNVADPSLLGGLRVRIGDRLYDGSLVSKLSRLEKKLKESQAQ